MNSDEIKIHLNDFDGPLELLLHLIKQSKMDIYDIDIKDITDQYVDYLNKMKKLNIEIAGDFFVMAANLMKIKSQLLLAKEIDQDTDEEEDPREDLVNQLIEYKKYKRAANVLKQKEREKNQLHSKDFTIVHNEIEIKDGEFQIELLQNVWDKIMRRQSLNQDISIEKVSQWEYEIPEQIKTIKGKLDNSLHNEIAFFELFSKKAPLEEIITDFLAVLTLVKQKSIMVIQAKLSDDIIIKGV